MPKPNKAKAAPHGDPLRDPYAAPWRDRQLVETPIYWPKMRLARLVRERKHALRVLRECEAALEARGSYSPVRLAACIKKLERPA